MALAMESVSASRPVPISPPARRPDCGSTMITPRERRTSMLCCTLGCSHISVCIAGHNTTGARVAINVATKTSCDKPIA